MSPTSRRPSLSPALQLQSEHISIVFFLAKYLCLSSTTSFPTCTRRSSQVRIPQLSSGGAMPFEQPQAVLGRFVHILPVKNERDVAFRPKSLTSAMAHLPPHQS